MGIISFLFGSQKPIHRTPRVIIESSYAGNVEHNTYYLRKCMNHSLLKGEAPYASHGLYTQPGVLDDKIETEREMGLHAGWAWMDVADLVAVYCDNGVSEGMRRGIQKAREKNIPVEHRSIYSEVCANCGARDSFASCLLDVPGETRINWYICRNCGYRKKGTGLDKGV